MATMEDVKAALKEIQSAVETKTAGYEEKLRKLEAKMGRQALALGGAFADESNAAPEMKAFDKFLRTGERETKGMTLGTDPDGGYAATEQLADAIVSVGAEQGAIRKLSRLFTPKTADFRIPISPTRAGAGRTTETGTRAATAIPGLASVHPPSGGIYAVAPVSNWLLNDASYNIAAFVIDSIGEQFGVTESADFVTGDGVNKAAGFLSGALAATADATRAFGTVEKLHAGSTTDFDIDDLIDLLGKLAPRYRKNAAFVMHPDTETYVRKLKSATSGEYYWQPSVAAGVPPTLLGIPSHVDVNMPTIASAAGVVAIADWSKFYAVEDVGETTIIRDPYTSKGNTLFYVEKRVGGAVVDSNAGKVLVMST
jgi:HK97 family phage major capsid protein